MAEQRESPMGFHFVQEYRDCPYRFYMRYVMGFRPRWTKPAFIYGAAIHDARADFYTNGDIATAIRTFQDTMESRASEYREAAIWKKDWDRGPRMLTNWISTFGAADLVHNEVLGVEVTLEPTLPNGFKKTSRFDAVLRRRDSGEVWINEAKTTGQPYSHMINSVFYGDQVTDYLWAVGETRPDWDVQYAVADVMWQNGNKDKAIRSPLIYRGPQHIREYVEGVMNTLTEMTQKVLAISTGDYEPAALFPRNTSQCTSHNSLCPYAEICRSRKGAEPPPEFVKDEWRAEDEEGAVDAAGIYRLFAHADAQAGALE